MENRLEQPVSPNQIGEVLPNFEIDQMTLERAAKYVMGSKTTFESQRQKFVDELAKWDRAYRVSLEEDRSYHGIDDKCAPIIHDNCEALISRLKEAILPVDDDLVELDVDDNNRQLAEYRTKELNDQLDKQDIRRKIDSVVRQTVKFGTAIIKVPMVNSQRVVLTRQIVQKQIDTPIIDDNNQPIIDPQNGQPMIHSEVVQSVEIKPEMDLQYFGPGYQVIDNLEDVYVDPLIENIQDQPIVIHRILVTWGQLQELVEKKVLFKEQVEKIKGKAYQTTFGWSQDRKIANSGMGESTEQDGRPKLYELFEAYCDFSIPAKNEEGTEEERVYPCKVSVIGNTTVGIGPNPYFDQKIPYLKVTYRRIEGEFYGEGAIQPVLRLFHLYNDVMNRTDDSRTLSLNPIKIQRAGSLASKQDLDIEPGTTWYEQQSGDIRFAAFDFGPVSNGEQSSEIIEQKINRGMGISPLILGQGDSMDLDKTWRGTQKIIAQSDKKFKSISLDIEDVAVRQWAEFAYKRNLQFNPIIGMDGSFQQINGELGFEVKGVESFFQKQEKILNMQMFTQGVANVPGMNIAGLVNESAHLLGIEIDEAKYGPLYTPPQPPPPESKPMNLSVNMTLDPSKGVWQALAVADILNKKEGIQIDLDAINAVSTQIAHQGDEKVKAESGVLPAKMDSYAKGDKRN